MIFGTTWYRYGPWERWSIWLKIEATNLLDALLRLFHCSSEYVLKALFTVSRAKTTTDKSTAGHFRGSRHQVEPELHWLPWASIPQKKYVACDDIHQTAGRAVSLRWSRKSREKKTLTPEKPPSASSMHSEKARHSPHRKRCYTPSSSSKDYVACLLLWALQNRQTSNEKIHHQKAKKSATRNRLFCTTILLW